MVKRNSWPKAANTQYEREHLIRLLSQAISHGSKHEVEEVLKRGLDLQDPLMTSWIKDPLLLTVVRQLYPRKQEKCMEIIKKLVKAGLSIDQQWPTIKELELPAGTLLAHALKGMSFPMGHTRYRRRESYTFNDGFIKTLLDLGADPNQKIKKPLLDNPEEMIEVFALEYAVLRSNHKIVDRLLKAGANPNALGSNGDSIFLRFVKHHASSEKRAQKLTESFLEHGADIFLKNKDQWSVLDEVSKGSASESLVSRLILAKAEKMILTDITDFKDGSLANLANPNQKSKRQVL